MKAKSKILNIVFWILSLSLSIFAIINQKYLNYHYIFMQFIISLIAFTVAIYLFLNTNQGSGFYKYWLSSVAELKKVTWPNKKEVMQSTLAVIVMVLVTGLVLWTADSILIKLVAWLLQRRW